MQATDETVEVWDPLVRLTHWSLALCFGGAYWLGGDWLGLHAQFGYIVLLLLGFRIIWGFVGSEYARFKSFWPTLAGVVAYCQALGRRQQQVHIGHDPLGSLMIYVLLLSLFLTAGSGVTLFAMEARGPLAGTLVASWPGYLVESVHHLASDLTIILVVAHVCGVLIMGRLQRQPLVRAMVTGQKRVS
ncbi:MAG: cytochrome B [Pseudomonadales bacterium]|nr:cytochrome B [Pseudomonadales bacterium]